MSKSEYLELVKEMAFEGEPKESIQNTLKNQTTTSNEASVKFAERFIDEYVTDYQLAIQAKAKNRNIMIIGLLFLVFGVIVTLGTMLSGQSEVLLAWGAILGGGYTYYSRYKLSKEPLENFVPRQSRIKSRKW